MHPFGGIGEDPNLVGVPRIADVLDERSVPVEEDRRGAGLHQASPNRSTSSLVERPGTIGRNSILPP